MTMHASLAAVQWRWWLASTMLGVIAYLLLVVGAYVAIDPRQLDSLRTNDQAKPTMPAGFRPQLHFTAPRHWLNDPCAPVTRTTDGHIVMHYQYTHHVNRWAPPLLWNRAVSEGLYWWKDAEEVAVVPEFDYERLSVFSGSGWGEVLGEDATAFVEADATASVVVQNVMPDGDLALHDDPSISHNHTRRVPAMFYTGITHLPLHWALPYTQGSETQNMLYFDDSGHLEHAQKFTGNPLLSAPPSPWEVTGWRDPFVFRDVHLDALVKGAVFGEEERGDDDGDGNARVHEERFRGTAFVREVEYNYMLLGGGVRHYGGAIFLYVSADLIHWEPMAMPLFHLSHQALRDARLLPAGFDQFSYGFNWEMPNLLHMNKLDPVTGLPLYLLYFGAEGSPDAAHLRGGHQGVWVIGTLALAEGHASADATAWPVEMPPLNATHSPFAPFYIDFRPVSAGLLDYALLYAVNTVSFPHPPATDAHQPFYHGTAALTLGWVNEDWAHDEDMADQEFAGAMGVPRELWITEKQGLAVMPLATYVKTLREQARNRLHVDSAVSAEKAVSVKMPIGDHANGDGHVHDYSYTPVSGMLDDSTRMEISVNMTRSHGTVASANDTTFGLLLHHNCPSLPHEAVNQGEFTLIEYIPAIARVVVSRTRSSVNPAANAATLWLPAEKSRNSSATTSSLNVQVFLDHSVLEVFVNGEFSLATRIYPGALLSDASRLPCAASKVAVVQKGGTVPHAAFYWTMDVHWDIPSIWEKQTRPTQRLPGEDAEPWPHELKSETEQILVPPVTDGTDANDLILVVMVALVAALLLPFTW